MPPLDKALNYGFKPGMDPDLLGHSTFSEQTPEHPVSKSCWCQGMWERGGLTSNLILPSFPSLTRVPPITLSSSSFQPLMGVTMR